jgi:hypothetical protein
MNISKQKQRYTELQAARAELIDTAVTEIAAHLEGLDAEICGEILAQLEHKLTGQSIPNAAGLRQTARELQRQINVLKTAKKELIEQVEDQVGKTAEGGTNRQTHRNPSGLGSKPDGLNTARRSWK